MAKSGAPSRRRKLETSKIDESRRFSTSAVRPPPLEVEIGGRWYEVDSDLDIDVIEQMLAIEEIILAPDAEPEDKTVLDSMIAGRNLIRELLEESNEDVPKRLKLGLNGLMGIFQFLINGRTVAVDVSEALAEADLWGAEADGEPVGDQPESELDEDAETAPLAERSTSRSSRSGKPASGRSTGGRASRGGSSGSTSQKQKRAATG